MEKRIYNKRGVIVERGVYREDGARHGHMECFIDGKLAEACDFRDDKYQGEQIIWRKNGAIVAHRVFDRGRCVKVFVGSKWIDVFNEK